MKVLIAESDIDVADTALFALETFGHEAVVARSLDDAIRVRRDGSFDVYLIDMDYPDCGGLGLLGSLRREDRESLKPRAIGWTGVPTLWDLAPAAGLFDAIVAKPVSLRTLMAAFRGARCPECGHELDSRHLSLFCHGLPSDDELGEKKRAF